MKKVLFLTLSYPSFRKSATILCTHRVMEACAKSSAMEVHCMCLQYKEEKAEELINGIYVHRVPHSLFEKIKSEVSSSTSKCCQLIHLFIGRLQKVLTIPLYPSNSPFQLRLWKKYANDLLKVNSFDCVIAEHYGYNTLLTGCFLKRNYPQLKYISLLWDPIVGQEITTKLPKRFTSNRINYVEKTVGDLGDMIISTVAMQKYYMKYGDSYSEKRKFLDIPNILPPEDEKETDYLSLIRSNMINIVFSGYVDSHRNPTPVLELLNNCRFAENLNILFFCKGVDADTTRYWKTNFKGNVVFHKYIPLLQLHTIYRHADYLLNISSLNPNLIPSKIFEYMSFGKPIISAYVTEGDSAKGYLDQYPESCVIDLKNEFIESVEKLDIFLAKEHPLVDFEHVQELFPNNTPSKYVSVIQLLLNN